MLVKATTWKSEDINFHGIIQSEVSHDERVFLILVCSSFLEITAPSYTASLTSYYHGNQEIVDWLNQHWLPEELEHGRAVKAYINAVWPRFDWQTAYNNFYGEYRQYCVAERFQPSKGLEMLARCVTETGAATYYKTLRNATREPVLKDLMDQMSRDEVRHYKHFLGYFRHYNYEERNSQAKILRTIFRRAARVYNEDTYLAFQHAYRMRHGEESISPRIYSHFISEMKKIARDSYPYEQAVTMLIQPLGLGGSAKRISISSLVPVARLCLGSYA